MKKNIIGRFILPLFLFFATSGLAQNAKDYFNKGVSQIRLAGVYQETIDYFDKAIDLNLNFTEAYYYRGIAKGNYGDYLEAIVDLNKAIRLRPNYAEAFYERGNMKGNLDKNIESIADYSRALQLKNNYFDAYVSRAYTKKKMKDYRGAIEDFTKIMKLAPPYKQKKIFDYETADEKIIYDNFNNPNWQLSAQLEIIECKDILRDYVGVIIDCDKVIQKYPRIASAYYYRGTSKLLLKQKDSGCRDLSKAGELGYSDAYSIIKDFCK